MTFSASGKRTEFAKEGLSSITVIEKPTLAENYTNGLAMCPPPKMNKRGLGKKGSINNNLFSAIDTVSILPFESALLIFS